MINVSFLSVVVALMGDFSFSPFFVEPGPGGGGVGPSPRVPVFNRGIQ